MDATATFYESFYETLSELNYINDKLWSRDTFQYRKHFVMENEIGRIKRNWYALRETIWHFQNSHELILNKFIANTDIFLDSLKSFVFVYGPWTDRPNEYKVKITSLELAFEKLKIFEKSYSSKLSSAVKIESIINHAHDELNFINAMRDDKIAGFEELSELQKTLRKTINSLFANEDSDEAFLQVYTLYAEMLQGSEFFAMIEDSKILERLATEALEFETQAILE